LIEYVTSLQPKQGLPGAERAKRLLDEISIFPALPPTQADLDTSLEACLTEAETALNSGDDLKSRNARMKVLTSLNASAHLYPRAAILLALAPSGSRDIKITYLIWGLKMIDFLDLSKVPAHVNIANFRSIAVIHRVEQEAQPAHVAVYRQ
jgi:hypothetical protein